jgi:hypothetical protein
MGLVTSNSVSADQLLLNVETHTLPVKAMIVSLCFKIKKRSKKKTALENIQSYDVKLHIFRKIIFLEINNKSLITSVQKATSYTI